MLNSNKLSILNHTPGVGVSWQTVNSVSALNEVPNRTVSQLFPSNASNVFIIVKYKNDLSIVGYRLVTSTTGSSTIQENKLRYNACLKILNTHYRNTYMQYNNMQVKVNNYP